MSVTVNPLLGTGNYSATSNNMKLVHWPERCWATLASGRHTDAAGAWRVDHSGRTSYGCPVQIVWDEVWRVRFRRSSTAQSRRRLSTNFRRYDSWQRASNSLCSIL